MNTHWVMLVKIEHWIAANVLQGWLQAECIPVLIQRQYLQGASGEIPFADAALELWVPAIKLTQAQQLLVQYEQQLQSSGPDWSCTGCTEHNDAHFEVCWHCGTPNYDNQT